MQVQVSFLQAKGDYSAELPDPFDPRGEAHSVVVAFDGARSLTWVPDHHVPADLMGEFVHRYDVAESGVTVSLYDRQGTPPTFAALWRLPDGLLATFMDEPTPYIEALETVVRKLTVASRQGSVPRVNLNGNLKRGDTRDIPYRDALQFFPRDGGVQGFPVVRFREEPKPPKEPQRGVTTDGRADYAFQRLPLGVHVEASGPVGTAAELEQLVDGVASTLEPM
jgi:hypothetical protein